jgi:DNA-binding transcriptional MerR regulator
MPKSADAFRTISEVADWLETPAHVLRFWESKFSQVKPVKRAGGRRYYRPADMLLLGGIKKLLHDDGMTIKGVQKVLREHGVKHVAAMSQPLDEDAEPEDSGITLDAEPSQPTSATVVDFKSSSAPKVDPDQIQETTESAPISPKEDIAAPEDAQTAGHTPNEAPDTLAAETEDSLPEDATADTTPLAPSQAPDTLAGGAPDGVEDTVREALSGTDEPERPPAEEEPTEQDEAASSVPVMPSFQHHRADDGEVTSPETSEDGTAGTEAHENAASPAPAQIKVPDDPDDDNLSAAPGLLSELMEYDRPLDPATAQALAPLIDRLRALQESAAKHG